MNRHIAVTLIGIVVCTAACVPALRSDEPNFDQPSPNDRDRLQGKWTVIKLVDCCGLESNIPKTKVMRVRIEGQKWIPGFQEDSFQEASFTLHANSDPKHIDLGDFGYFDWAWREDLKEESRFEKSIQGIYEFDGDTVRFCLALHGRPESFAIDRAHRQWIMVLKRTDEGEQIAKPKPKR